MKKNVKTSTIIFDIDGTLANLEHRLHFIEREKGQRDWKSFNKECDKDLPIQNIIDDCNRFAKSYFLVLCTGREETMRKKTVKWLDENSVHYDALLMRKEQDYRDDTIVKQEMHDLLVSKDCVIQLVYDDRPKVIRMWEANNLKVIHCGDGVEF